MSTVSSTVYEQTSLSLAPTSASQSRGNASPAYPAVPPSTPTETSWRLTAHDFGAHFMSRFGDAESDKKAGQAIRSTGSQQESSNESGDPEKGTTHSQ